mgnify:CR=1 FL=1
MQAFDYFPINGHGVAHINGRKFLIDPGLPYTIAQRPMLIDGRRIEVESRVNGLTAEDFSDRVGIDLDGVLGANLGSEFVINILPQERSIVFDQHLSAFPINVETDNIGGVATVWMSVAGQRVRGALDLGSSLSLIRADRVETFEPVGRDTAVVSFMGAVEVDVYHLPVMLENEVMHLRFGAMPAEYAEWLEMANVQAVLGHELLQHYAVSLAIEEGLVSLDPLSATVGNIH